MLVDRIETYEVGLDPRLTGICDVVSDVDGDGLEDVSSDGSRSDSSDTSSDGGGGLDSEIWKNFLKATPMKNGSSMKVMQTSETMPVTAVLPDLLKGRLLAGRRGAAKLMQILKFSLLLRMELALDRRRPSQMRLCRRA